MKNKKAFLVFTLALFLCLFQLGLAYAEYAHIVNKDTHGTLSKEGIVKMNKALLEQDLIVLDRLTASGEMVAIKEGAKVFLQELAFMEGYALVQPEGEEQAIWVFTVYLTPESEAKNIKKKKTAPVIDRETACRIDGFFVDNERPAIMIGEAVNHFGDSVCGGQIINVTTDRVTIKFPDDRERMYRAGEVIE